MTVDIPRNCSRKPNRASDQASLRLLVLLLCLYAFSAWADTDEWHFSGVDRIVAVSDIHGAYDALVATLRNADVIDQKLAWSGGKTQLVITGDLLDRGPDSRRVMDLIMRLEQEAPLVGGRVHQLLGNHEVMNLIGDLRYVSGEEYAAFLDIETARERRAWYKQFLSSKPADSDEARVRREFDQRAPPGFFGHRRAFRHDGVYGKWLLSKPLMVVINDTLFVHGGVPPLVAEYGLARVDTALRNDLQNYVRMRAALDDASVMSPIYQFRESLALLEEEIAAGQLESNVLAVAEAMVGLGGSPLHGPAGPTWYRGTASCSSLVEGDGLNLALQEVGAKRVVFGHTPTITRQVQQRMNGQIIEIDTGMLNSHYEGSGNALVIEGDEITVVNQSGKAGLSPIAHPLRVGHESMDIDDQGLAEILAQGTITETIDDGAAWKLVQVTANEITVSAYFKELPQDESFTPELAAYKLDRMLGLGMVPVTVRREIGGLQGTLQFVPPETMTERERVADGQGWGAPCAVQKQMAAMYVFDALINNVARTPSSMLYSPEDWLLLLIDHENSFGAESGKPTYLKDMELAIGDQWRTRLLELDNEVIRATLGDVLDDLRLDALGKRRDALVDSSHH